MNSENIYDAITNINDDFIVEIKDSKGKKAHWRILLVAAIITMLAAGTALATWFLRAPDEAAMQDPVLAAYLSLEGTVIINESIDDGDYRVTLLGIAQGDAIISLNIPDMPLIEPDSTYVITAVQKLDGSDMPLLTDSIFDRRFYAVAGIRGISPWEYLLSYGTMTVVTEGVYIMLTICDDLEPFADRGAYIVVSHEISFTGDAIIYDEITGEVKANEEYDGISVVFALPLDSSKADPERAEEIMQGWSRLPAEISIEIDKNMIDADGRFMFPSVDELAALPVDEARAKMAAVSILGSEWGYYLMQSPLEDFELMADHIMACTVVDGNIR
ncbi:MAG: hypothetical protein FWH28_09285 [Clostridiales bacterium]|nr:hypothetical protein [Clostridiales bacterium]